MGGARGIAGKEYLTCAQTTRRVRGRRERLSPSFEARGCVRHAAVAVQKSSFDIEIDTIHDQLRVPTLPLRPNFPSNL